ncbi:MAG TPA: nucleoside diphosphate kinase regulator [Candidatus Binatia bacterium]|nr:nucleoside diphosphate kinase regulator [Candidatus Binatia bacterium]
MATLPRIVLSRVDRDHLDRVLENAGGRRDLERLREEIERAEIVEPDEVPADVVTMNSTVRFSDEETGEEREMTLVFPAFADVDAGRVSVLAPVGSALLGLSVGDSIDWPMPSAGERTLRVIAITYQPEAAGADLGMAPER